MDTTNPVPAYLGSIVRTAMAVAGGYLVAKGYVTTDQIPEVGGAVLALVTLVWSLAHKAAVQKAIADAISAGKGFQP